MHDTFIIAAVRLGGLRTPGRLRPWLYAVARNECRRQLASRGTATLDPDSTGPGDDTPTSAAGWSRLNCVSWCSRRWLG